MSRLSSSSALIAALLATACGGGGGSEQPVAPINCDYNQCASLSGHSYVVYEPAALPANAPMLLLLHGANTGRNSTESMWQGRAFADRYGYRLVIPQGKGDVWNYGSDVQFVADLIDTVQRERGASAAVFIAGWSNGSALSQIVACDHADKIVGVVSLAGPLLSSHVCQPARPVAVALMAGANDSVVPVATGAFGSMGMGQAFTVWERLMACKGPRESVSDNALVPGSRSTTTVAGACAAPVQQTLMDAAGHAPNWAHAVLHERLQDFFLRAAQR